MDYKQDKINVTRLKLNTSKPSNTMELQQTEGQKRKNYQAESFTTEQMVEWVWYKIEADAVKSFAQPEKTKQFIEDNRKKILIGCDAKQKEEVNARIDRLITQFDNRLKLGVNTIGSFWIDKYDRIQKEKVDCKDRIKYFYSMLKAEQSKMSELELSEIQCIKGIQKENEMKMEFEGIYFDEKEGGFKILTRQEEVVNEKIEKFQITSDKILEMNDL